MTKQRVPLNRPLGKHRGEPKTEPQAAYEVGYGKPPRHSQFRPGRSGNPKGRPKRHRNLRTVVEDALGEAITIREGEKTRKTSRLDALVRTVLNKALQGDAKILPHLIALIRLAGLAGDEAEEPSNAAPITEEDEALIKDFLRRFGQQSDVGDESGEGATETDPTAADDDRKGQKR